MLINNQLQTVVWVNFGIKLIIIEIDALFLFLGFNDLLLDYCFELVIRCFVTQHVHNDLSFRDCMSQRTQVPILVPADGHGVQILSAVQFVKI